MTKSAKSKASKTSPQVLGKRKRENGRETSPKRRVRQKGVEGYWYNNAAGYCMYVPNYNKLFPKNEAGFCVYRSLGM